MALLEQQLSIKKSKLRGAGLGLFSLKTIAKGSRIVEYKGRRCLWRNVKDQDQTNAYLMRVDRSNAIDASRSLKTFGRYANDARGTSRKEGLINNAEYVSEGKRCFIEAIRDIPAGGEILVNYGKDYWKVFG
jgi:SET domain-containing protein